MNKKKLFITAIVGLLVANLVFMGFMAFRRPPHPPFLGPKKMIVESLHFDKSQEVQFDQLIMKHKAKMANLRSQLNSTKVSLYHTLSANNIDKTITDSIFSSLSKLNSEIEIMHYNHFLDIKKICRNDQMEDFEILTTKMAQFFSPEPRREK